MQSATLGRYELLEELSREVDGVIYKARDPLLDRLVAIKSVELGAAGVSPDLLDVAFERKAKLAGPLTHPNIVIVHDVGKSGDVAYIATELLDGQTLYEMLAGVAPFTENTADEVVAQITSKNPAPPSALNHNIRSGFDYIVARAMAKDPDHRYQTAREMASDLRKWALEEPRLFSPPVAHISTVRTAPSPPSAITVPSEGAVSAQVLN